MHGGISDGNGPSVGRQRNRDALTMFPRHAANRLVPSVDVSPKRAPFVFPAALRPSPDELAVNRLYGEDVGAPPLPPGRAGVTGQLAIATVIEHAVREGNAHVLLDGTTASAAIYAAALRLAHDGGYPEPVAIDWFASTAALPSAGELLGEHVRPLLQQFGVLAPAGWTTVAAPITLASGGTLLTSFGFGAVANMARRPSLSAVAATRSPRVRDLRSLATDVAPPALVRAAVERSTSVRSLPWITPNARRRLAALEGRRAADVPVRFDDGLRRLWVDRRFRSVLVSMQLIGELHAVRVVSPFADPSVLAALIDERRAAHPTAAELLGLLGGDAKHEELEALARKAQERAAANELRTLAPASHNGTSSHGGSPSGGIVAAAPVGTSTTGALNDVKATSTRLRRAAGGPRVVAPEPWGAATRLGPRSREWIQQWDGSGVDVTRVDSGALRRELLGSDSPNPRAFTAIQLAWLKSGAPDLPTLPE